MKTPQKGMAGVAGAAVLSVGVWQVLAAPGSPDPSERGSQRMQPSSSSTPSHPVDKLLEALKQVNRGQVDKREDQDRGFGARRLYLSIYPDCNYWISLLAIDGSVASASISYSGSVSDASWARVVKSLRSVGLPVPREQAAGAFGYYSFTDKARLSGLSRRVAAELGEQAPVSVPKNLRSAYDALLSPTSSLVFGSACGVAGTKPAGRAGAEALQKARRVDLLGNILRGPNTEGSVYAAQALESLAAGGLTLSARDREAIAKVKALPILISACSGCMPESQTAAQLLSGAASGAPAAPATSDG